MKIFKKILSSMIVMIMVITNLTIVMADDQSNEPLSIDKETIVDQYQYTFSVRDLNSQYEWNGEAITPTITLWQEKVDLESQEKEEQALEVDKDYTVEYKNNYRVGTAEVIIKGKGDYTGTISAYYQIVQNQSKMTITDIQPTSAKIQFNAIKGAKNYTVQLKNTSGKVVKTVKTEKNSVTFSQLAWGRKYSVEVKANAVDKDEKSYSYTIASSTFTTSKATTKITFSNVKTTSAQVKFTAVSGATKYVVKLKNSSGKVIKTLTLTKPKTISFSKLSKATKYTVEISAYAKDESQKTYSAVVGTSTFSTLPVVGKVTISSVKGGNEMAQVNWKAVSGASGYEIYRSTNAKSGFKKIKTVSNQTKSYTNYLLSTTTYYYKVRAYKKVNGKTVYGSYSAVKSCKTKKPTNTTYYLRVNTRTNVTTVYAKNFSGKYVAVKSLTTSCGVSGKTKAILGTHYTQAKYRWKFMHEDCYTQYATRITGHYLFHSIPYSQPKPYTMWYNSYNKLGNFASAGCVRLRVVDAKWIYDHCPVKTKTVVVYSKTDPLKKQSISRINTKSKNRGWDPTDPDPKNPWKK